MTPEKLFCSVVNKANDMCQKQQTKLKPNTLVNETQKKLLKATANAVML
jgi:hypothetical protein